MSSQPKICVVGHKGMVRSAIVRAFFAAQKSDQVYLAAAKVGGIHANNTYPAEHIYQNLMIEANIVDAAFQLCPNTAFPWLQLHLSEIGAAPSEHAANVHLHRRIGERKRATHRQLRRDYRNRIREIRL